MTYVGKSPADIIATAVDTTTGTFSGDLTVDTNTLYVDSANNRVGVGTVSPDRLLHIYEGNSGIAPNTSAHLTLESDGANFFNILKPNGTVGGISFSGNSTNADGRITYDDSGASRAMQFYTASTEAMRIDSSQNFLVGKTAESGNTAGHFFSSSGYQRSTRNGGIHIMNRITTDGSIIDFQKDGSAVGSIGTNGTRFYLAGSGRGLAVDESAYSVLPVTTTGANSDGGVGLGSASARFSNLYLSGGAYIGGTGSANYLDDYEEGTWTAGFSGATVSATNTTAYYTKIGRQVFFNYYTDAMTISSASGGAVINGLPFAASNADGNYGLFTFVHGTAVSNSKGGFITKGTNVMTFITDNTNSAATYVNGTGYAMVAGFYFTA